MGVERIVVGGSYLKILCDTDCGVGEIMSCSSYFEKCMNTCIGVIEGLRNRELQIQKSDGDEVKKGNIRGVIKWSEHRYFLLKLKFTKRKT